MPLRVAALSAAGNTEMLSAPLTGRSHVLPPPGPRRREGGSTRDQRDALPLSTVPFTLRVFISNLGSIDCFRKLDEDDHALINVFDQVYRADVPE